MPLVFVHGVATRPTAEYAAMVAQRDALFRSLVFNDAAAVIENPDWGSFGAAFDADLPWLPDPKGNEAFAAEGEDLEPALLTPDALDGRLDLGTLAGIDAEQAIDLVVMAALDSAIRDAAAAHLPAAAGNAEAIALAEAAGSYLEKKATIAADKPVGIAALATGTNSGFADALTLELRGAEAGDEAFGIGDRIRDAVGYLGRLIGNSASDAVLKAKRRDLSRSVSLFLGDVFVYLRGRDSEGPEGTRARIFAPIIEALIAGINAKRSPEDPVIVIGHSLGGVLLVDILGDPAARATIEAGIGGPIAIDAFFTVGSQPGFFADLGLFPGGRLEAGNKRPVPEGIAAWMNVFDFTDVFSFRCAPMFEGVRDFGYDTVTDVLHAHSAYFLRPSFYKRMRARLEELRHA